MSFLLLESVHDSLQGCILPGTVINQISTAVDLTCALALL